jgi:hypothetical protein
VSLQLRARDELSAFAESVVEAVVAGREFGSSDLPDQGDRVRAIPGELIWDLVLGLHGALEAPAVSIHGVTIVGDVDLSYRDWRGKLDLSYCRIDGAVLLEHAEIRGRIVLSHSVIDRVDFASAQIDGSLVFRNGVCAKGVYGLASRITGSLDLRDSELWAPEDKPNRCALELFRARIGDIFLIGSTLLGGVYANGCTVDRNVRLQEADVVSREVLGWPVGPGSGAVAVSLTGATLGGALYLSREDQQIPDGCVYGGVALARMTCRTLQLRSSCLDSIRDVEHLDYGRLRGIRPEEWLEWLSSLESATTQPFSHFASYVSDIGRQDLERSAPYLRRTSTHVPVAATFARTAGPSALGMDRRLRVSARPLAPVARSSGRPRRCSTRDQRQFSRTPALTGPPVAPRGTRLDPRDNTVD